MIFIPTFIRLKSKGSTLNGYKERKPEKEEKSPNEKVNKIRYPNVREIYFIKFSADSFDKEK